MPEIYQSKISSLLPDGSGLARVNALEISIPGALPGDIVSYQIVAKSQHRPQAWAKLIEIITPGSNHTRIPCAHAAPMRGQCGGCPLMHMTPALQRKHKQELVQAALQEAGIVHLHQIPYHEAPSNLGYRNRCDWVVGKNKKNRIILGSYAPKSHRIVPLSACVVMRTPLSSLLSLCTHWLNRFEFPVWPQEQGLRYLSFFSNDSGEVLADFVFGSTPPPAFDLLVQKLKTFTAIKGISYCVNSSEGNALRTSESELVWGENYLPERLGRVESLLSASGFTQLNSSIASEICETTRQWAGKARIVWDLYCGSGALGRNIDVQKSLFGAEISNSSIIQARESAKSDTIRPKFETMNLDTQWPDWEKPDLILVNPPRKGLSPLVIHQLRNNPTRLIYMSCNPSSFAQNARALSPVLELTRLEAFDMLAQTNHVELLGLFEIKD